MKKAFLFAVIAAATFTACKKDETKPTTTTPTPNTPTVKNGFIWKEDGGAEITADSAFWTTWGSGTGVRAYKNGMANFFEVNWDGASNTTSGAKNLLSSGGFTFIKGSDTYLNTAADKVNVTAISNDSLSGNFDIAVSSTTGSIKKLSATFTNIPKK